jgi:hypothetical protein
MGRYRKSDGDSFRLESAIGSDLYDRQEHPDNKMEQRLLQIMLLHTLLANFY